MFPGLVNVSLKPSVLSLSVMSYADVKAGMAIQGTVVELMPSSGLLIALTPRIRAFCPNLHLTDAVLKKPQAKFKVGQVCDS